MVDPSLRPFDDNDLKKIALLKAEKKFEKEICSICCDEIKLKQKIR